MRRIQLFEFEDLPWVPVTIRDGATDLLDVLFERLDMYGGVASRLDAMLAAGGTNRVFDLCSGGGGGTLSIVRKLLERQRDVMATFTDRYPNANAIARITRLGDPRLVYRREPVDALAGGGDEPGVRTCAGALHHFPPEVVRGMLGAVVARRAPLAFFDVAASPIVRRLPLVLAAPAIVINLVLLFVAALVLTPLVRPLRASRLVLTYAVPLIPLLFAWDGTVSALRAYTPDELLAFARSVPGGDAYEWHVEAAGRVLCLTGHPRHG